MRCGWLAPPKAIMGLLLAGMAAGLVPAPVMAQDDARMRKIEAEIRALQRQVFPGADGRFFTPEVDNSQPQVPVQAGTPSTSALTDMLARLSAIESQLAQLTARTEENAHALSLLQERVDMAHPPAPATIAPAQPSGIVDPPAQGVELGGAATVAATAPVQQPTQQPSAERMAAVLAIAKPVSDDAGEDEYTYGFRLWDAKLFPEARQQLSLYLENFPDHSRVSYGRNLLGRAYLDDGKPSDAARYFLDNYQADKGGARAPDSLLFLSEAMIALGDTNRACIALAEFGDNYPALATGRLQNQYERNRGRVDCS